MLRRTHDGCDSHLISIKASAHVHEKVGGDIEPVDATATAHETPLLIKAMFLLKGHCIFAMARVKVGNMKNDRGFQTNHLHR